jgi:hypothetical protein
VLVYSAVTNLKADVQVTPSVTICLIGSWNFDFGLPGSLSISTVTV